MSAQQVPGLYYASSPIHGRGVFCRRILRAGDVIEIAPVFALPADAATWIRNTPLHDYYFQWGRDGDAYALAWGYASLYNHSRSPNAEFIPDFSQELITFKATTEIPAGEEITIDYHAGLKGRPVWFEVRDS